MTKRKKVGLLNKIFVIWSGKGKRNPKTNCKSIGLLDVEQLKAKACDIHDQFDLNKDGRVTL